MTKYEKFKVGKMKFEMHAFRPAAFENGLYAVSIKQSGKPSIDKYTYFKQIKAGSARKAMEEAKLEFLAKLAHDLDTIERLASRAKKVKA